MKTKKRTGAAARQAPQCRSMNPRYGVRCNRPSGHISDHYWNNGAGEHYAFAYWHPPGVDCSGGSSAALRALEGAAQSSGEAPQAPIRSHRQTKGRGTRRP